VQFGYAACVDDQRVWIIRGCGEKVVIDGLNIHQPADWKTLFTNDENNIYTCLLLEHWSSPSMIEIVRRPIIFIEAV